MDLIQYDIHTSLCFYKKRFTKQAAYVWYQKTSVCKLTTLLSRQLSDYNWYQVGLLFLLGSHTTE